MGTSAKSLRSRRVAAAAVAILVVALGIVGVTVVAHVSGQRATAAREASDLRWVNDHAVAPAITDGSTGGSFDSQVGHSAYVILDYDFSGEYTVTLAARKARGVAFTIETSTHQVLAHETVNANQDESVRVTVPSHGGVLIRVDGHGRDGAWFAGLSSVS